MKLLQSDFRGRIVSWCLGVISMQRLYYLLNTKIHSCLKDKNTFSWSRERTNFTDYLEKWPGQGSDLKYMNDYLHTTYWRQGIIRLSYGNITFLAIANFAESFLTVCSFPGSFLILLSHYQSCFVIFNFVESFLFIPNFAWSSSVLLRHCLSVSIAESFLFILYFPRSFLGILNFADSSLVVF